MLPESVTILVLAGGAGSRLGGTLKPALKYRGSALIRTVIGAARTEVRRAGLMTDQSAAIPAVVVGDRARLVTVLEGTENLHWAQEEPPGSGPVAAVAAGLSKVTTPWIVLLAADLPEPDHALRRLLMSWAGGEVDGVVLSSVSSEQPLFGLYRTAALRRAVSAVLTGPEAARNQKDADGGRKRSGPSLRRVIAKLKLLRVTVSEEDIADIDEPEDARFWGIEIPEVAVAETKEDLLARWCEELLAHYEIPETPINIDQILSLAGAAAHTIIRPAAPLTTFIAGYAAGIAAGSGQATESLPLDSALAVARSAVEQHTDEAHADATPDA